MKNKFILFIILTVVLFVFSAICFGIMKIGAEEIYFNINETGGTSVYYFNIIFGLIGLILYNFIKIIYDKMFNKIYKTYSKKNKRILLWIFYVIISIVFWGFVFINSDIGGGLTDLYQFEFKTLHGIYIIDILFILPLWNIIFNIIRSIKKRK